MSSRIILRHQQEQALQAMKDKKNIFITGAGGVGKTALIKHFTKLYQNVKTIAVTSTTGTSALLINGTTLYSYLGIGLGKGTAESICSYLYKRPFIRKRWVDLQVLVIDEVSMLSPNLFDKLEEIARVIRHSTAPFGGIQLILSGDFLQIPCIDSNQFCFQSEKWDECVNEIFYLDEIIRQSDPIFQNCLNDIRLANFPTHVVEIIESRVGAILQNDHGIIPTKLFPLNKNVNYINNKELDNLIQEGGECLQYELEITVHPGIKNKQLVINKFETNFIAPSILQLCVGAQVMLLYNLDLQRKLANGSRGVVTRFVNDMPVVKFLNGIEQIIDYHTWEIEENDVKQLSATQIPLKLAYSISIHKSQGSSLDYAEIDLSNIFEYGMAYVALSRVKSLEGLSIINIDWDKIKANPDAVEFYKNL